MTHEEVREQVRRRAILKIIKASPRTMHLRDEVDNLRAGIIFDAILSIPEIKEGLELYFKVKGNAE